MAINEASDIIKQIGTDDAAQTFFNAKDLLEFVVQETTNAEAKIQSVRDAGSAISIADMFEMQQRMNRLSQVSEMTTAVVSAANSAISSMARNVK